MDTGSSADDARACSGFAGVKGLLIPHMCTGRCGRQGNCVAVIRMGMKRTCTTDRAHVEERQTTTCSINVAQAADQACIANSCNITRILQEFTLIIVNTESKLS